MRRLACQAIPAAIDRPGCRMGHMCGLIQSYLPHGEPQQSLWLLHHGSHNTAFYGVGLLTVSTWRVHLLQPSLSAMQDLTDRRI